MQMKKTRLLLFLLLVISCNKQDSVNQKLAGYALIFRHGGVELFPDGGGKSAVTITASRDSLPRLDNWFDDPQNRQCTIFLFKISVSGQLSGSHFKVHRFLSLAPVTFEDRKLFLERVAIPALNGDSVCATEVNK